MCFVPLSNLTPQVILLSSSSWYSRFLTMVLPTRAMALSTSISRLTIRSSSMAFSVDVHWRTSRTPRARTSMALARSITKPTLPCGRKRSPSTSCAGHHPGVTVSPAGTVSALPWDANIWVRSLISMEVAWT